MMMSVVSSSTMTINMKKINPKFIDDVGCVVLNHEYQHEEINPKFIDDVGCVILNHDYQHEENKPQIHWWCRLCQPSTMTINMKKINP